MASTLLLAPLGAIVAVTLLIRPAAITSKLPTAFVLLLVLGTGVAGAADVIEPETVNWLISGASSTPSFRRCYGSACSD